MNIHNLISSLHPLEIKVLPLIKEGMNADDLVSESNLSDVEVIRAIGWLANKEIVLLNSTSTTSILLDENGLLYLNSDLPERKFLNLVSKESKTIDEIKEKAGLSTEETYAALGLLKSSKLITLTEGRILLAPEGEKYLNEPLPAESFLKSSFPKKESELSDEDKQIFLSLKKRKNIVRTESKKIISISLTDLGRKIIKADLNAVEYIGQVTSDIIRNEDWREKKFRKYDLSTEPQKIAGGRRHPLNVVINKMRAIWLEMGFKEMEGPWVESAFWCMDSMWIPQDHTAREMQDTFYLPYTGKLPAISETVAIEHETGGSCGSTGYGYKWDPELAKKLVLRTHTTATTFRLFDKGISAPSKYFCVGRIFRNESVDATHLPEFHQIEGFVMGEGLTLKDLMGYITEFYKKMGITKIKFRPTYNPYTEPSMEALGYNEKLGRWIELINSGMFRPEALEPYGIRVPVIAWGLGVERLAMMLYDQDNIRNIFGATTDLDWLGKYPLPNKTDKPISDT